MKARALLALLAWGAAGCAGPSLGGRAANFNATEKMMWSTYPLGTRDGLATGFVITRKDALRPGVVVAAVVTSAHVLDTIGKGPLVVGVRVPDAAGEPRMAIIEVPASRSGARFYVRHPRQDIGAFELKIPADVAGVILPSFLGEKALNGADVRAGAEVSFLGFPDVVPGTSGAFPVLRNGKVASYPTAEMHAERLFLINADVYPGDSGGPVFAAGRGAGRPQLLGMIVKRIGRNAGAFAHFAIAVDANAIRETLQLLSARESQP